MLCLEFSTYLAGLEAGEKRGFERDVKAKVNTTTISDCPIKPIWHKVADGDFPKEDSRARTLGYYLTASKHKSYSQKVVTFYTMTLLGARYHNIWRCKL